MRFKRLNKYAKAPNYPSPTAKEFDVFALIPAEFLEIKKDASACIKTGLSFEVPAGYLLKTNSFNGFDFNTVSQHLPGSIQQLEVFVGNSTGMTRVIRNGDVIGRCSLVMTSQIEFEEINE